MRFLFIFCRCYAHFLFRVSLFQLYILQFQAEFFFIYSLIKCCVLRLAFVAFDQMIFHYRVYVSSFMQVFSNARFSFLFFIHIVQFIEKFETHVLQFMTFLLRKAEKRLKNVSILNNFLFSDLLNLPQAVASKKIKK